MTSTSVSRYRVGASVSSVEVLLAARTAAEDAAPLATRQLEAGVRIDAPLQVVGVTPGPPDLDGALRFVVEAPSGALGTILVQPSTLLVLADLIMGGRGVADDRSPSRLEIELVAERLLEPLATILAGVAPGRPAPTALVERALPAPARSLVIELAFVHGDVSHTVLLEVFARHAGDQTDSDTTAMEVICAEVPLELSFKFEPVSLRAADVSALAPGDVICLDHRAGAPVVGEVDGTPFLTALVGTARRRAAVEVVELIERSN